MVGCFELFAREGIGSIAELKGKSIGVQTAGSLSQQLVTLMAAQVGLDPVKDIQWVTDPSVKPIELFVQGKIDAFLGFRRAPGTARPAYRPRDRQHRGGPPVVAIFLLHDRGQPGLSSERTRARPSACCAPSSRRRTSALPNRRGLPDSLSTAAYSPLRLCPADAERQPLQMAGI